jgi:integrase
MVFSFARVGAANTLHVGNYFENEKRWWLRLHEKGGKRHDVPCHHSLAKYLDSWIAAGGIGSDKNGLAVSQHPQGQQSHHQSNGYQ